jgi:hypothetical protein
MGQHGCARHSVHLRLTIALPIQEPGRTVTAAAQAATSGRSSPIRDAGLDHVGHAVKIVEPRT